MFDRFIAHDTTGKLKAMTLEWTCPKCNGENFRILFKKERDMAVYKTRCRYCKSKFRVNFPGPATGIANEEEFLEMISEEKFSASEQNEMIRDFAEIEYLKVDKANPQFIAGKQKELEQKIALAKKRMRI